MRRKGRRADALRYRHEDTGGARDYMFIDATGRHWLARATMTLCGHWFSSCDDDHENRRPVWRWDTPEGEPRVTCPDCLAMMKKDE